MRATAAVTVTDMVRVGGYGSGCCSFHGMSHHGSCMGGGWRRFVSPAEELERLHNHLAELKNEIAGVRPGFTK